MALKKEDKKAIVEKFKQNSVDTGSAQVQIALLTEKINYLNEHFKTHKHDFSSKRGLMKMVGRRRKFLKYIERDSKEQYKDILKELGLRK